MAPPTDYVLLDDAGRHYWRQMSRRYTLPRPWEGQTVEGCEPWGWSQAVKRIFVKAGIDPRLLPSEHKLDILRRLSHRRLTVEIHSFLRTGLEPIEAFTPDECIRAVERWHNVIAKYPWSSSGRGIFHGGEGFEKSFLQRCTGAIGAQGSVMIEQALKVDTDFAMLFHAHLREGVRFVDYSLMLNHGTAYAGHQVLPSAAIHDLLSRKVGQETLENTRRGLEEFLSSRLIPHYEGYLGVDMMVYIGSDGHLRLNPCVEVNLRHTMGTMVSLLRQRHLPAMYRGRIVTHPEAPFPLSLSPWQLALDPQPGS